MTYKINHTDKQVAPIELAEEQIDQTSTDVALFGRKLSPWGELLDENVLHLLERFSCPESLSLSDYPDTSKAIDDLLQNPIYGQLWFNETKQIPYYYNGNKWLPLGRKDDIAANWGVIGHGMALPNPVSSFSGYEFPYSECSWIVSPAYVPVNVDAIYCNTSVGAVVNMRYRYTGDSSLYDGVANYLIVGIRNNINGTIPTPTPSPTPTGPVPTPTPTPNGEIPLVVKAIAQNIENIKYGPGDVEPYYKNGYRPVSYPGMDRSRAGFQPILYPPDAPYAPWEPQEIFPSVFRHQLVLDGIDFPDSDVDQTNFIFVSNDGFNGVFYGINNIVKDATRTYVALNTDWIDGLTSPNPNQYISSGLPPTPSFDYQRAYFVIGNSTSDLVEQRYLFRLASYTGYQYSFDLDITGGLAPYEIVSFKCGDATGNKLIGVIYDGLNEEPLEYTPLYTLTDGFPTMTGTVMNGVAISNGQRIEQYATFDFNFISYGAAEHCFKWVTGEVSTNNDFSSYASDKFTTDVDIVVKDARGRIASTRITPNWHMQCCDYVPDNLEWGYQFKDTPAHLVATSSGIHSFDLELSWLGDSVFPYSRPSALKYIFSIVQSPADLVHGNFVQNGQNLAYKNASGVWVFPLASESSDALVHVYEETYFSGNPLELYDGITGSVQQVLVDQYIDVNGNIVDISASPIVLKLYPFKNSEPVVWDARNGENLPVNSDPYESPTIPYDLKLDIILPSTIPVKGSIVVDVIVQVIDNSTPMSTVAVRYRSASAIKRLNLSFNQLT